MYSLTHCPACNSNSIDPVFPGLRGDNTLFRLLGKTLPFALSGFNLKRHATSEWSSCGHCALLFARNRPKPDGLADWYPKLFQISEERNYNQSELPVSYLEGKAQSAQLLLDNLNSHNVLSGARNLIQFRTGPGHLLALAKQQMPTLEVFGLEYFEHPAAYARKLIGNERIQIIDLPEPKHGFDVGKFDVVISNHFLTHAHDPKALMTYYKSILASEGKLLLFNELDHDLSLRSMTAYRRGLNFFHKQLFTRHSLIAFVESCGFDVKDISKNNKGKMPKYITLLCTHSSAKPIPSADVNAARKLLRSWRRKHLFYRFAKPVIEPVRRLLG